MSQLLQKALNLLVGDTSDAILLKMPKVRPFKKLTERELIQLESEIGATLFGPIPEGYHRKFFNLDPKTWIWYEESVNENGTKRSMTTRYEVQQKGILKAQDGANYSYLEGEELRNFGVAVQMYYERVMREVYNRDPQTGRELS
ncbi:MAG TPA: hypothetical protein VGE13_04325 [Candidatus Saccharimonadales bacterium]